jgi:hypothetical protein
MYLTDVLDFAIINGERGDVPREYIEEQAKRMDALLKWGAELEGIHDGVFPSVPFAPGFLMYLDYLIHLNTTGTKQ